MVNRVEKIKHQYHVFQKRIGYYYQQIFKEGETDMGTKPNVVKESITPPIAKKNTDTFNKI